MSPPQKDGVTKGSTKCESSSKQKIFSFRWLLRKSKSSRSHKEMTTPAQQVTTSKSCDTGLTAMETEAHATHGVSLERCPTSFLLWKLLPPPGASRKPNRHRNPLLPFRASFSCNDVHGLATFQGLVSSESSRDMNASLLVKSQQPCFLQKLSKSTASRLDASQEVLASSIAEDSTMYLCKLCLVMVPISMMYTLEECGCSFCMPCLSQYLLISIREGHVPVTCPDADCPPRGTILIPEIEEIAGEDAMFMFQRYKLNLDVALDPARVWCPSPGCETICSIQPNSLPQMVRCHTCRLKFCSICKLQWHARASACTGKSLGDDIEGMSGEKEACIKQCPNCLIPIEKEDGCAQMMCYRCRHVFCWHCLASLDDDFLLRHYDKGPCRNKLGHSRASIIWHRTQVVGIFAGFSLLILLASPFLLLAAPCLLCCRGSRGEGRGATPL